MMQQQIVPSAFKKLPIIVLPLIALISTITIFHILINQNISYSTIGALFSLAVLSIGILAYHIPAIWPITLIIILTIAGSLLRTAFLHHSYHSFPFSNQPSNIEGTILSIEKTDRALLNTCLTISLRSITRDTGSFATSHTIQIYTTPPSHLKVADRIKIKGIVIKKPNNEQFWHYLMKEGVLTSLSIQKLEYTLLYRPAYSVRRWFFAYKNNLLAHFKQQLSPATFHLFASLFLGIKNKKALETVNRQFKQWGIMHYLARSGLHLVIVITIYEAAFRFIPLPFKAQHLILLLLGILYYLLSWSSISFIRAFIMFIYYKLSTLSQTPPHFLHILLATCYIVLLSNPMQLFFLDFQLSFSLTFALGWLNLYRTDAIARK